MPFPPTCQSPVTCDGAPIGRKGDTWLCMACLGYTDKHKHFPEFPMSTVRKQIIAYVQQHGATHTSDLARAINASVTSVSTVANTLRREGVLMPAKGDGVIRIMPAPDDSALPDAVPGHPLLWQSPDRQGGAVFVRGTRVDVVTLWMCQPAYSGALSYGVTREQAQAAIDYVNEHPELQPPVPEDTVQTSEADVLRAEVARLTEELAVSNAAFDGQSKLHATMIAERDRLIAAYHTGATVEPTDPPVTIDELCSALSKARGWYRDLVREKVKADQLTVLHGVLDAQGLSTNPAELGNELDKIRASMLRSSNENRELRAERSRCPAVRLEWSPWEDGYTQLTAKFGRLNRQIASIHNGNKVYATIDVSDVREDGDVAINISGVDMKQVTDLLRESLMALAGLTMPPIPTLPESA